MSSQDIIGFCFIDIAVFLDNSLTLRVSASGRGCMLVGACMHTPACLPTVPRACFVFVPDFVIPVTKPPLKQVSRQTDTQTDQQTD